MAINEVPTLPSSVAIVDPKTGYPSAIFQRWWQDNIAGVVNALVSVENAQAAADAATAAAAVANDAATAAQAAADTATTGGAAAQAAADAAQAQADATAREAAITGSYITPTSVLSSTTTTISVAAHSRTYPTPAGPVTVSVAAGSVAATGAGPVVNYVSYTDPARTGGVVTYVASTTQPAQTGDVHVVGAITVPAAGTATGGQGPRKPGYVEP